MPTFFYNNHHPFNRGKSAITNLQAHINNNTPPQSHQCLRLTCSTVFIFPIYAPTRRRNPPPYHTLINILKPHFYRSEVLNIHVTALGFLQRNVQLRAFNFGSRLICFMDIFV